MRSAALAALAALLSACGVPHAIGQGGEVPPRLRDARADSSLAVVERALWAGAADGIATLEGVFDERPGLSTADALRDARGRAVHAATQLSDARAYGNVLAVLRRARGLAPERCPGEVALAQQLALLVATAADVADLDAEFLAALRGDDPLDVATLAAQLPATTAPARALVAAHVPQPVCPP